MDSSGFLMTGRFVIIVLIGSLGIFPDLGNATILALVALIMYTLSGIAYRWFTLFYFC